MNAAQRYSNRATAQEARAAIRRHAHPLWPWQLPVLTDCMKPSIPFLSAITDRWSTETPGFVVGVQEDFSTALDQVWVSDSCWSPIRLAISNRLSDRGWRGNPSPCWPESTRIAYCRQQGLPHNTPEETCRRLQRYGFLASYAARNDAEQGEMETLRTALLADGIEPGWDEVPRRETTDEDLAVFQIGKERP